MVLVSVTGGAWAAAVVPPAELAKPGRVLMPRLLGAIAAKESIGRE